MLEIRPAIFDDYAAIASLHADNWRNTYRGILSDQYLEQEVEADRHETWRQRMQNPNLNQRVIVAEIERKIVGFSCLLLNDDPVFGSLVDNLHVASNAQNAGLGKRLLQQTASIVLEQSSVRQMYLWVYEQNSHARSFYDRMLGHHFETVIKENESGNRVPVCRYTWEDAAILASR